MIQAQEQRYYSSKEYLDLETTSEERYEYIDRAITNIDCPYDDLHHS